MPKVWSITENTLIGRSKMQVSVTKRASVGGLTLSDLSDFINDAVKAGFSMDTEVAGPAQLFGASLPLFRVGVSEERPIPE